MNGKPSSTKTPREEDVKTTQLKKTIFLMSYLYNLFDLNKSPQLLINTNQINKRIWSLIAENFLSKKKSYPVELLFQDKPVKMRDQK